ncbi:MAG: hypothetical protein WAN74_02060 [Thermoplasmata archaeon]
MTTGHPSAFPVYETVRLCSGKGSYEALPRNAYTFDLARARHLLESDGVPVTDARVMLIVATKPEMTLSRNGRILIKTRDAREAERALDSLLVHLKLPGRPSRSG